MIVADLFLRHIRFVYCRGRFAKRSSCHPVPYVRSHCFSQILCVE